MEPALKMAMAAERLGPVLRSAQHPACLCGQSADRRARGYLSASRHLVGNAAHSAPGNARNSFEQVPRLRVLVQRLGNCPNACKYPPAEPVALRLLAPQRGLFATVRSKSKNKSKSIVLLSSLPQHRQFEGEHTPGILKVLLPPRQSRGISLLD